MVGSGKGSRAFSLSLWPAVVRLCVLAPAVSGFLLLPLLGPYAILAAAIAFVSAAVIGAPALWAYRRHRAPSIAGLTVLGALAGTAPAVLVAGWFLLFHGDSDRVFAVYALFGALSGAVTGSVYWAFYEARVCSTRSAVTRVAVVAVAAWAVLFWPQEWWPKTRVSVDTMTMAWEFGQAVDVQGMREVRVWQSDRPDCVASLFVPALVERLQPAQSGEAELVVRRTRSTRFADRVAVEQFAGVAMPSAQVFSESCLPWQ